MPDIKHYQNITRNRGFDTKLIRLSRVINFGRNQNDLFIDTGDKPLTQFTFGNFFGEGDHALNQGIQPLDTTLVRRGYRGVLFYMEGIIENNFALFSEGAYAFAKGVPGATLPDQNFVFLSFEEFLSLSRSQTEFYLFVFVRYVNQSAGDGSVTQSDILLTRSNPALNTVFPSIDVKTDPTQTDLIISPFSNPSSLDLGLFIGDTLEYRTQADLSLVEVNRKSKSTTIGQSTFLATAFYRFFALVFKVNKGGSLSFVGRDREPTAFPAENPKLSAAYLPSESNQQVEVFVKIVDISDTTVRSQNDFIKIVTLRKVVFDMRYTDSILTGDRVLLRGRTYRIDQLDVIGRNKYLRVTGLEEI